MTFLDRDKVKIDLHLNRDFFIPGQTLRGRLHLTVTKNVSLTAVRLRIMGKEKALRRANCRTTMLEEFTHLERVMTFVGATQDSSSKGTCKLAAGDYDYPFQLELPATLPPSLYCPVRRYKTKLYYFVEAHVIVPNGFDGRKRQYFTLFPAAPRRQWEVAHAAPYGLTRYAPEQLGGANMVNALTSQQLLRHHELQQQREVAAVAVVRDRPVTGEIVAQTVATAKTGDTAAEKEWAQRQAERDRAGPGGSAVSSNTAGSPASALVIDDAVRLPLRKGRLIGRRKDPGWLELSAHILPCVMALSTHAMFPIVSALNEASNTRMNRVSLTGPGSDHENDTEDRVESHPMSGSDAGEGGALPSPDKPTTGAHSEDWTDPVPSIRRPCARQEGPEPSAPTPSDESDHEKRHTRGSPTRGNRHGSTASSSSSSSSASDASEPETVCAPLAGAGWPPAPPAMTVPLPTTVGADASDYPIGGTPDGDPSFRRTLTTYDDCRCLTRLTLHNATRRKKIRGVVVTLVQHLRFNSAGRHATQTVRLAEGRFTPPQGPLRPGQTITFDVPLQLPGMLRMNGEMDSRLPIPTLRTRTVEVTNILMVSFKGRVRLEHQFSRSDCIALVSAVDETNTVPEAPFAYLNAHVFPEELITSPLY